MDQELIAYLDQRFQQIDDRFQQIDGRFQQIDGRFQQIDGRFQQIDGRFRQSDSRFDRLEETVRHTQVTVEALRGEIRQVAEGVAGANERLDSFRAEVAQEFTETRQFIRVSYSDLDRRIRPLEGRTERRDQDPMDPL